MLDSINPCSRDASFTPHRFACLVHVTLIEQPFGQQEAFAFSHLPSLRSLHILDPATGGAFSDQISEGYTLPAPCMLTQLTSLSLDRIMDSAGGLSGILVLTNLHSLSCVKTEGAIPSDSICSWPSLKHLTALGPNVDRPLPMAGKACLQVLYVAGLPNEGCWDTQNNLTAVTSVTKLR